jgi:hypothetical protein
MVRIGIQLRALFAMRMVLICATALASAVALLTACNVGLAPPTISLRASQVVGAHTEILVDGPSPGILSTLSGTTSYQWLRNGGLLLGNIMTSEPGAGYIARRAHLSMADIDFTDPQSYFATATGAAGGQGAAPYSLTVASDPSVPMIDVYAQAPTAIGAMRLVNAAFTGLHDYLTGRGATATYQLRIRQLGHGRVISTQGGSPMKSALLRFVAVFVLCAVVGTFLRRSRESWRLHRDAWAALRNRESKPTTRPLLRLSRQKDS